MKQVALLPRDLLVHTAEVDRADWNYRPVLGAIQRKRFSLACSLMGDTKHGRLLEVGYGSGVFMPQLARHCSDLYGADIHSHAQQVQQALEEVAVTARLDQASVEELPFESGFFDCVVAVSTFGFVLDLDRACREVARVMSPRGSLIVVVPARSPLSRAGFRLVTGESLDEHYEGRLRRVLPTLEETFAVSERRNFPQTPAFTIYHALRCHSL